MYKAAGLDGLGLDEGSFTSWASLVAQRVKRLPAMQESWVQSLDQKDLLEKPMDRGAWRAAIHRVTKGRT